MPLNKEIASEEVIGKRFNEQGKITEEILKREIHQNYYAIIGPDGPGKNYFASYECYFKNDKIIKKISDIEFYRENGSSYNIKTPVRPVTGSTKWVAIQGGCPTSLHFANIYIIIFDKNKTYKMFKIPDCRRKGLDDFEIEFKEGNKKAVINTKDGRIVLDAEKCTLESGQQ
ncbi:MAG: hypothetical protein WC496_07485 [Phycisphaerae bacterium]|jgi:hypothetical protein